VTLWLCVAPLRLGGLRGKKSTPSVWLGGTGEFIEVGKQEQEQLGTGAIFGGDFVLCLSLKLYCCLIVNALEWHRTKPYTMCDLFTEFRVYIYIYIYIYIYSESEKMIYRQFYFSRAGKFS
jgi:hypothetical protein